jgi:dTDP-4-dehydrorhamnose reductase
MKILVTGSNGMLGSNLVKLLPYDEIVGYDSLILDITNIENCRTILENEKPDIIIHTAAYTDVEGCEKNIDKAYRVNTLGTQNLVNYCVGKNILFIYISSTGIYGTFKENTYNEFDEVKPTTIHHKSKYEAEKIVQNHLSKYLIIRTGWLFGGEVQHAQNFVYKRYVEAKSRNIMHSDNSQIGNPTYIRDLIKQINTLIENNQYGIFNCVNKAKNISRYDYVKKIVELFELDCRVIIGTKDMFKRIAEVSKNESAENYKLELIELNVMNEWDQALREYIIELKVSI